MESIIETFHIDWRLLIAQVINFGVVAAVLWFFALKPLTSVMTERTKTIEKSLEDAKAAALRLQEADTEKAAMIKEARLQAQEVITAGQVQAAEAQAQAIERAREQVKKVVEESRAQIKAEQQQMITDAKAQVADVVVAATAAILGETVDKKIDAQLVKQAIAGLNKKS